MKAADVIYINTIVVLDFILLARFFKKPIIVHVREIPNGIEMLIFRFLLRWSRAKLIFNSQATRDAFALPKEMSSHVVYNGIDIPAVIPESAEVKARTQVLMIGRLNHWKGQEILIEAIAKLAPHEREQLEVRIVGSTFNAQDDILDRLHRLIEARSLQKIIRIDPFEVDTSHSFIPSDLVVVPSRLAEPFGNVAIEAMAFSKPVIASNHGGLVEIVRECVTGRLFEPGSADALCGILQDFLENRELYRRYGEAGRLRLEQNFSAEASDEKFILTIADIIASDMSSRGLAEKPRDIANIEMLCVHPGYEMYGADRCFARAIGALTSLFSQGNIRIVLPQQGPILQLPPLGEIRRQIRPLWVLRRRTVLRSFTLDICRNVQSLVAAYRDMRAADVVYINAIVVFDYILMARFVSKAVIVHVHEIPNGLELVLFRWLLLWSRASLIYNSEATAKAFGMPDHVPGRVVYNGVDAPILLEQDHSDYSKARVLMIGRLNNWKGQEVLIDAVGQLTPAEQHGLEVRIVGSTFNNQEDIRVQFERMIEEKHLTDVIRIDPFEPDTSSSYRETDLVVVPSRLPEPFGCVAIEAMGFCKPVVASRHGGLTEIVSEGETGKLFSPGNAEELCALLRDFLHNRETYRSYGAEGRRRFDRLFTAEQSNQAFVQALTDLAFVNNLARQTRSIT
jgi:glycosyltransferase involved in cell wall biosynthesis